MDLNKYSLEDLLLTAMKSEIESRNVYLEIAKRIENGLLQDKLEFLAKEEEKHRLFIEDIYRNHFPDNKIVIPNVTPVSLPKLEITDEKIPISKILTMAMEAEKAAHDFYKSLSKRFEKGSKMNHTLVYFSDMEMGHYKILENEKYSMERFEEADIYWPMVHVGP